MAWMSWRQRTNRQIQELKQGIDHLMIKREEDSRVLRKLTKKLDQLTTGVQPEVTIPPSGQYVGHQGQELSPEGTPSVSSPSARSTVGTASLDDLFNCLTPMTENIARMLDIYNQMKDKYTKLQGDVGLLNASVTETHSSMKENISQIATSLAAVNDKMEVIASKKGYKREITKLEESMDVGEPSGRNPLPPVTSEARLTIEDEVLEVDVEEGNVTLFRERGPMARLENSMRASWSELRTAVSDVRALTTNLAHATIDQVIAETQIIRELITKSTQPSTTKYFEFCIYDFLKNIRSRKLTHSKAWYIDELRSHIDEYTTHSIQLRTHIKATASFDDEEKLKIWIGSGKSPHVLGLTPSQHFYLRVKTGIINTETGEEYKKVGDSIVELLEGIGPWKDAWDVFYGDMVCEIPYEEITSEGFLGKEGQLVLCFEMARELSNTSSSRSSLETNYSTVCEAEPRSRKMGMVTCNPSLF